MSKPDVHSAIIARIEGKEFLIDAGYASPFTFPIQLYIKEEFKIHYGSYKYLLKPRDASDCSKLELYFNNELIHGYYLMPYSKNIYDFNSQIYNSFNDDATFTNSILLTKTVNGKYIRINNLELSISTISNTSITKIRNIKELAEIIEIYFGISRGISYNIIKNMDLSKKLI